LSLYYVITSDDVINIDDKINAPPVWKNQRRK